MTSPSKSKKNKNHRNQKKDDNKAKQKLLEAAAENPPEQAESERKMKRAMEDPRFAGARSDPKFRPMKKKGAKVAIDSRFSEKLMSDPSFAKSAAAVDKRGKKRNKGEKESFMLRHYLNQEEEIKVEEVKEEEEESEERSSSSDDDEEEEDDDQYSVNSDIVHYLMASHEDTLMVENETYRLAVVNMDWDHIKAVDLYMVMISCLPKGGKILSVAVYPTQFGIDCMKNEAEKGPAGVVGDYDGHDNEYDSDTDNNRLRTYELNRLRYYFAVVVCDSTETANQLYKTLDGTELLKTSNVFDLRFIPDTMEFKQEPRDIVTEAPASYKEPNFETRALQHSRVKLTWDEDEPERKNKMRRKFNLDEVDELEPYLASSDEDDEDEDITKDGDHERADGNDDRGGNEIAIGEGHDSLEGRKRLRREELLSLLQPGDESDAEKNGSDQDMEITFNTELEDLSKRILEKREKSETTCWEKVLEKRREKRKARKKISKDPPDDDGFGSEEDSGRDDFFEEDPANTNPGKKRKKVRARDEDRRREMDQSPEKQKGGEATTAELELMFADDDADHGPKGYNMKPKKVKGKKRTEKPIEEKLQDFKASEDPRFSALLKSHLFALDPTDPQYKRSAVYLRERSKKQGLTGKKVPIEDTRDELPREDTLLSDNVLANRQDGSQSTAVSRDRMELSSSIRSLKRNVAAFKTGSKGRR